VPANTKAPKRVREEILRVLGLAGIPLHVYTSLYGPTAREMWLQSARDILVDAYPGYEVYWREPENPGRGWWLIPSWDLEVRRANRK